MAILIFVLVFAGLFGISVLKDMFPDMSIYVATAIAFSPFYLLLAYIARGAYRNVHSELKANTNINPALLPLVTIGALIAFVIGGALIAFIISIGIVSIWILLEKLFSKPAPKDK